MASDLDPYLAEQLTAWLAAGQDFPAAPDALYVSVFDDTGIERNDDFPDARAAVSTSGGWTVTGDEFENANTVLLGAPDADVTGLESVALFDGATGANELARYDLSAAPVDIPEDTTLAFAPGDLTFDVVNRTE